jgi:HSP20 family molecular chaperone IbpA
MSGIKDIEKLNQRQLESIKRRNERELRTLAGAHENYKAELKKVHDDEVVDLQNAHVNVVNEKHLKKEKVLGDLRRQLDETKFLTDKELRSLKDSSNQEKGDLYKKLSADRDRINAEHELYLEELDHHLKQSSEKLRTAGKQTLEETKNDLHDKTLEQNRYYQEKVQKLTQDFSSRYKMEEMKNMKLKDEQDSNFKKERLSTNLRQQHEMGKMTRNHSQHFEAKTEDFRKGLKEQERFFEKKFDTQMSRQLSELKGLEDKNKKIVEDLKSSLTREIATIASKNDDPFYKFETLEPELRDFKDRVEVSVKVPDHSKQDMHLTINGKEAILNFNRRYHDAARSDDGTINKVNKVETFTSRLQGTAILDPKSVKATYEDGVMTYVIKKA